MQLSNHTLGHTRLTLRFQTWKRRGHILLFRQVFTVSSRLTSLLLLHTEVRREKMLFNATVIRTNTTSSTSISWTQTIALPHNITMQDADPGSLSSGRITLQSFYFTNGPMGTSESLTALLFGVQTPRITTGLIALITNPLLRQVLSLKTISRNLESKPPITFLSTQKTFSQTISSTLFKFLCLQREATKALQMLTKVIRTGELKKS